MKVILRQDVEKLGAIGDVVDVADGYARNYLVPQEKAYPATAGSLKRVEEEKQRLAKQEVRNEELARQKAAKMGELSLEFVVKATEEDQLYGSVAEGEIAEKLAERGYEVDRKMILLEEPLKALGVYTVEVRLHAAVTGQVKVWIVRE